jgi:SAM-dependent methyltransferase
MNQFTQVSEADVKRIHSIPHFRSSIYHDLDIVGTLDFYNRRFVQPLACLFDLTNAVVVDCGAGYGWFSFAYVMNGGKRAVAVDIDADRLTAAREIAKILAVDDRVEFIVSTLQTTPLVANGADLFVSIETLEHVGKKNVKAALQRISSIASQGILITTPNRIFPLIAHDTCLPFAHWLPARARRGYATLFGRQALDGSNDFVSPFELKSVLGRFKPASSCFTFQDFAQFMSQFPIYVPYGSDQQRRWRSHPSLIQALYDNYAECPALWAGMNAKGVARRG